jgi:predicted nucleic acid-binding protein
MTVNIKVVAPPPSARVHRHQIGRVVPDASVILKWVLQGPDEDARDPSLSLKDSWLEGAVDLVVPTLWVFEVGKVLGLKQPANANVLLQAVVDLALPEEPAAVYTTEIFRLMYERHVTFYDAAYHALAISRRGTMLTADRRYVERCRTAGHVRLIEDWEPPAPQS